LTKKEVIVAKLLDVLIVEDSESDTQLVVRWLKKAGYEINFKQVETGMEMRLALEKQAWDIVISDYNLPKFNGNAALALLQETGQDIPFIVISGTVGEEIAVGMMKAGATDYLMKGNLARLAPVIERELIQAKTRRERMQAEDEIYHRLSELSVLYESGLALNQLLKPEQIGQKIIDLLEQKLSWHHTTIRMYNPQDKTLKLLAFSQLGLATKKEQDEVEQRFQMLISRSGQGMSGWVVEHGQSLRSGNLSNDSRYIEIFPNLNSGLYVPVKLGERTIGVISIESKQRNAFSEADERLVTTLAAHAGVAIDNSQLFENLQHANQELALAYDATIEGWSRALDLRDKETEGHTLRVTEMTIELAHAFDLDQGDLVHVRRGALLHDIGKMGIPDAILLKPGPLTDEEWVLMMKHPVFAYEMLFPIHYLHSALDIPYCHHEKWDGSGYPRGLKGDKIPLVARIFAIVDVWDALTSDRPYRLAWSTENARKHISSLASTHFDPEVLKVSLDSGVLDGNKHK
jgi:putative nucleotidyltransferase with HDIG domain